MNGQPPVSRRYRLASRSGSDGLVVLAAILILVIVGLVGVTLFLANKLNDVETAQDALETRVAGTLIALQITPVPLADLAGGGAPETTPAVVSSLYSPTPSATHTPAPTITPSPTLTLPPSETPVPLQLNAQGTEILYIGSSTGVLITVDDPGQANDEIEFRISGGGSLHIEQDDCVMSSKSVVNRAATENGRATLYYCAPTDSLVQRTVTLTAIGVQDNAMGTLSLRLQSEPLVLEAEVRLQSTETSALATDCEWLDPEEAFVPLQVSLDANQSGLRSGALYWVNVYFPDMPGYFVVDEDGQCVRRTEQTLARHMAVGDTFSFIYLPDRGDTAGAPLRIKLSTTPEALASTELVLPTVAIINTPSTAEFSPNVRSNTSVDATVLGFIPPARTVIALVDEVQTEGDEVWYKISAVFTQADGSEAPGEGWVSADARVIAGALIVGELPTP